MQRCRTIPAFLPRILPKPSREGPRRTLHLCRHSSGCRFQKVNFARSLCGPVSTLKQWQRFMSVITSKFPDTPLSNQTLAEYVFNDFEKYGNAEALVDGPSGRSYTFSEIPSLSRNVGSGLTKRGFKKGDVLCIFSANNPEYALAIYGTSVVGGIATLANPAYTADELAFQLKDSGAEFIVTVGDVVDTAKAAAEKCGTIKDIFVIGGAEGCKDFNELIHDDGSAFPENVPIDVEQDVAVLPYSSGTTGLPKGVELTHRNVVQNMIQTLADKDIVEISPADTSVVVLPFYHIYGLVPIMGCMLRGGCKQITLPKFDAELYLDFIQKTKTTFLNVVPPIALFLAKHPMAENCDLSTVRDMICGAAPLGEDLENAVRKRLGKDILRQGFGLTETSPVITLCPMGSGRSGSVGLLLPNTQAKIIDLDTGEELGPNQDGEIIARGPQVMKGYHNNQQATDGCIKDGWFYTGDVGHYDEDGYFYIVDRVKELIKYKGFQVPPAELEDLLLTHPSIADAAVIGIPDEVGGELPKGFVVLKPKCEETEETIMKFVEERVAYYKRLRGGVAFLKEIPKAASGKILRRFLRQKQS